MPDGRTLISSNGAVRKVFRYCQAQVQVQVPGPGQVQKVQGLRTKDLDLVLTYFRIFAASYHFLGY